MEAEVKARLLLEYLDKLIILESNGFGFDVIKSINNVRTEIQKLLLV